ncbi:hypothetical protein PFAG_03637 [Plasmodium falciparum Santa Lucia]|uniref:Plasmodium RESA N-terminal domain-containing protein n=1 Tax=Plasmodium falciparum Santa Lucia TaxID=478859 RepID=W7FMA5_PLAFA|nr:hypothetical protein PFAG_03637 [Plasmodium falciparum Santa Lucia]
MYSALRSFLFRKSVVSVIGVLVALLNNECSEDGLFSSHYLNSRFSRILSSANNGNEYDILDLGIPSVFSVFSLSKEEMMTLLKDVYGKTKKVNLSDEEKIIRDIKKYGMSCNYSAIPYIDEFGLVVYNKIDNELDADFNDLDELSETFKDDAYNHWVRVMKNEESKYFQNFVDLSTYYDTLKKENLILDNYKEDKLNECRHIVPLKAQKLIPGLTKIFEDWTKNEILYKREFETLINSVRIAWKALTNYALYEYEKKKDEKEKKVSNIKNNLRAVPQNSGSNFDEFLDVKEANEIVQDVLQEFMMKNDDEDDEDNDDDDEEDKGVYNLKKDETATINKDIKELEEVISVEDITNISRKITSNENNKVAILKNELSDFYRKQCEKHKVKVEGSRGVLKSCYNLIKSELEKLQGSLNKYYLSLLKANVLTKKDAEKYIDNCLDSYDDFRKKMKETCEQKIIKYFNNED